MLLSSRLCYCDILFPGLIRANTMHFLKTDHPSCLSLPLFFLSNLHSHSLCWTMSCLWTSLLTPSCLIPDVLDLNLCPPRFPVSLLSLSLSLFVLSIQYSICEWCVWVLLLVCLCSLFHFQVFYVADEIIWLRSYLSVTSSGFSSYSCPQCKCTTVHKASISCPSVLKEGSVLCCTL